MSTAKNQNIVLKKSLSPGQSVMAEPTTTTNNTPPGRSSSSQGQPSNSQQPQNSYNQQHWLIQEAEQRRIAEQQMRHYQQQHPSSHQQQQQQSPVYENSNYLGGVQMPHVPPPSQVGFFSRQITKSSYRFSQLTIYFP